MSAPLFCLTEEEGDDGDGLADSVLRVSADSFKTMLTSTSDMMEPNDGLMFRDDGEGALSNGLANRDILCGKSVHATSDSDADAKFWLAALLDGPAKEGESWDCDGRTIDQAHEYEQARSETSSRGEAHSSKRPEHPSLLYQFEHDNDNDITTNGENRFFKVLTDDEIGGFGSAPQTPQAGLMSHVNGASSVLWGSASTLGFTRSTAGASTDLFPAPSESSEQSAGAAADRLPPPSAPATAKKTPRMLKKSLPTLLTEMGTNHPLRILLVDDNPVILQSQSRQLEMLGYQCQLANNGKVALARLAGEPVDVMLLDLHMPAPFLNRPSRFVLREMDGFETAAAVKRNYPPEVRPTIIAVTGSQSAEESLMCLSLGIKYYLAKPLGVTDLATLLAKCQPVPAPEPKHVSTSKVLETLDTSVSRQKTLPRKNSL